jgi:hypothetical protein
MDSNTYSTCSAGGLAPHRPHDPTDEDGLAAQLQAAMALLPPVLGAASQPLEVGRATRVVQPAQRAALAVRDGGVWSWVCPAAGLV